VAEDDGPGFDITTPNVARIYDYLLGGKDHFAADRAAADKIAEFVPDIKGVTRDGRAFLIRAVRYLAGEAGIRQFLDLGAGLPTQQNVHEVAQKIAPDARVVYVDYDPVVCAHARALLAGADGVGVVQADLRQPARVLDDPATRTLLDFSHPVAVLAFAALHFVADDERPHEIVRAYRDQLVPGSHLAIQHAMTVAPEEDPEKIVERTKSVYSNSSAGLHPRSHAEIARFFDGFDLLEPGLVWLSEWRPDPGTPPEGRVKSLAAALGRKR
jgi:hypothetical protein